jgi:hypothetical protein
MKATLGVVAACALVTAGPLLTVPVRAAISQHTGTVVLSSTHCVLAGVLQADDAHYFCYTVGDDGLTGTYFEDLRAKCVASAGTTCVPTTEATSTTKVGLPAFTRVTAGNHVWLFDRTTRRD